MLFIVNCHHVNKKLLGFVVCVVLSFKMIIDLSNYEIFDNNK